MPTDPPPPQDRTQEPLPSRCGSCGKPIVICACTPADRTQEGKKVERLEQYIRDFAEHDCTYGDNCPEFGTRHGACVGCLARRALASSETEKEVGG